MNIYFVAIITLFVLKTLFILAFQDFSLGAPHEFDFQIIFENFDVFEIL